MFVGHYGVSFAARPVAPRVPLWVWFLAVQWLDVLWSALVLLGVEKLHIVPGITEANPFDLYYMPYTHSLVGAAALSVGLGAVVAACIRGQRARTFALITAAAFSHWLLDLVVHLPDLPLFDNHDKVGFGLWRHVWVSFPLEIAVMLLGAAIYDRAMRPARAARIRLWGFVAFVVVVQVFGNFGPIPTSESSMAIMALSFYLVLIAIAAWVERPLRAT